MTSRSRQMLEEHMGRTLGRGALDRDPLGMYEVTMLRLILDVMESALDDERVGPEVAERILSRVIYGCVPRPVDVQWRTEASRKMIEMSASMASQISFPVPR